MEVLKSTQFYDRLSEVFDIMTDWKARLDYELPFLRKTLKGSRAKSILDLACGTGMHAIALAREGYTCTGVDSSPAMIARARENARRAGVRVSFEVADFARPGGAGEFDAVLCLGNSLPHVLSQKELLSALRQIRAKLRPGGVLLLQNLNYDLRLKKKPRFFSADGTADLLVWRFADYGPKLITFHTALFKRQAARGKAKKASWSVQVNSTLQRPLLARDLVHALTRAGLRKVRFYGGMDGTPWVKEKSGDLVAVAFSSSGLTGTPRRSPVPSGPG